MKSAILQDLEADQLDAARIDFTAYWESVGLHALPEEWSQWQVIEQRDIEWRKWLKGWRPGRYL